MKHQDFGEFQHAQSGVEPIRICLILGRMAIETVTIDEPSILIPICPVRRQTNQNLPDIGYDGNRNCDHQETVTIEIPICPMPSPEHPSETTLGRFIMTQKGQHC